MQANLSNNRNCEPKDRKQRVQKIIVLHGIKGK